jgi:hypothetical protein
VIKNLKAIFVLACLAGLVFLMYRILFIRTVNYEIAGVKIPCHYNAITGKVTPITNYKGRANLPSVEPRPTKAIGLSSDQIAIAQLRWALFAQWASVHPQYKGWDTNKEIFAKAREAFKADMQKLKAPAASR